ncbi:uncharacterized protein LOC135082533 [Ostrinia nubilalis]|uniref:uncharacterized protein LOC135082533 n=1 Tax=Ostrinia nubilalis TaxID=29057 RepID=UPI0030822DC5
MRVSLLISILFLSWVDANKTHTQQCSSPALPATVFQGARNLLPPDDEVGPPTQPIVPAEPAEPVEPEPSTTSRITGFLWDLIPRGSGSSFAGSFAGSNLVEPSSSHGPSGFLARWLLGDDDDDKKKASNKKCTKDK